VRVYSDTQVPALLSDKDFVPSVLTQDSRRRRQMYVADLVRQQEETSFKGPGDAFLATLEMKFSLDPAELEDLARVEELVARTNQLNTTGRIYTHEELAQLRVSPEHSLLVGELSDKHGPYGKIGVVLLHCTPHIWTIKLLLMSCRVISRGVGGTLITLLRRRAAEAGVRLLADFRATDRNRMMYLTYKFAGFSEVSEVEGHALLEADLSAVPPLPTYLQVQSSWLKAPHG
jgi:FkbH-like protein